MLSVKHTCTCFNAQRTVWGTDAMCLPQEIEDVREGSLPSLSLHRALLLSRVWPSDLTGHLHHPIGPRPPPSHNPPVFSAGLSAAFLPYSFSPQIFSLLSPPNPLPSALKCIKQKQKVYRSKKSVKIFKDRKYVRFLCCCE